MLQNRILSDILVTPSYLNWGINNKVTCKLAVNLGGWKEAEAWLYTNVCKLGKVAEEKGMNNSFSKNKLAEIACIHEYLYIIVTFWFVPQFNYLLVFKGIP